MIFLVVRQTAGADENQEGAVWGDFGVDILLGAVAEWEGLRLLVGTIGVLGRVEALVALFVDGGEVEGAVGGDAGLPEGLAGEVDGVGQALRLAPAGGEAVDAPDARDAARRFRGVGGISRHGATGLEDEVGTVWGEVGGGVRPLAGEGCDGGLGPLALDFVRLEDHGPVGGAAGEEDGVAVGGEGGGAVVGGA